MTAGLLLSSCASVTISDHEVCGSLGIQGAACYHLLTDQSRTMNLTQFAAYWNDLTDPKVVTPLSTITDLEATIEKLCTDDNVCTQAIQDQVAQLKIKVKKFASIKR